MSLEFQQQFIIRGVPAVMVERLWSFAEPYVKRALDHTSGELSPNDLKKACLHQDAQLWLVTHNERVIAAITTEIVCYPQRKHLRIITLAGSHAEDWMEYLEPALRPFAEKLQCQGVEAYVRKGYVTKLSQYGFKHKYSVVVKEV